MNEAPVQQPMFLDPPANKKMHPAWVVWFSELKQVVNGGVQSQVKAADSAMLGGQPPSYYAPKTNLIFDLTVVASGGDGVHTINGPVTSVTTNGIVTLDGNAHGGYEYDVYIVNNSGSSITYRMYYNNDTANTDYDYALAAGSTANDAIFVNSLPNATSMLLSGKILQESDGMVYSMGQFYYSVNTSFNINAVRKLASVANLTRIDWTASASNGIGVGSRFRLWKRI